MDAMTFFILQFKCISLALQTDECGIFCDKQRCAEQTIRQEWGGASRESRVQGKRAMSSATSRWQEGAVSWDKPVAGRPSHLGLVY